MIPMEQPEFAVVRLYKFGELDEKIQHRIIEKTSSRLSENIDYDYDISCFLVKAEKMGIHVKPEDIRFSISGMQGDGASFVTDDIDFRKFLKKDEDFFKAFPAFKDEKMFDDFADSLRGGIERIENSYCHKDTVNCWVDCERPEYENEFLWVLRALEDAKDNLCNKFYDNLQATYDNEMSVENIRDVCENSNDRFYVDGTRANPEVFAYSQEAKQAKAFLNLPSAQREALGDMIDHEAARVANGLKR